MLSIKKPSVKKQEHDCGEDADRVDERDEEEEEVEAPLRRRETLGVGVVLGVTSVLLLSQEADEGRAEVGEAADGAVGPAVAGGVGREAVTAGGGRGEQAGGGRGGEAGHAPLGRPLLEDGVRVVALLSRHGQDLQLVQCHWNSDYI